MLLQPLPEHRLLLHQLILRSAVPHLLFLLQKVLETKHARKKNTSLYVPHHQGGRLRR